MIRSMTGYGRAEVVGEKVAVSVEARSLNHRHLDIILRLPRTFAEFESEARRLVQDRVHRGRVEASASIRPLVAGGGALKFDTALARHYAEQVHALGEALGLRCAPTLEWLCERPGVMIHGEPEGLAPETAWPMLAETLSRALENLVARREAEGEALGKELTAVHGTLIEHVERMAERAPAALAQRTMRVRERIQALLGELPLDEARLAMEVAAWAEKTDVSEELTRLRAHLGQFASLIRDGGVVGRPLDFVIQEMNREVNTIASKANDLEISQLALAAKGHLEKLREQVQNVE